MNIDQKIELLTERIENLRVQINAVSAERQKLIEEKEFSENKAKEEDRLAWTLTRIAALEPLSSDPVLCAILADYREEERKCRIRLQRWYNQGEGEA